MRYRTWGISLRALTGISFLPIVLWFIFRAYDLSNVSWRSFLAFYRPHLWVGVGFCLFFSTIWIYLFRRGIFQVRYGFYGLCLGELGYELSSAVAVRDLTRMGLALVLLFLMVGVYRWIENRVRAAHLNPQVSWFEGMPRTLPHIKAKIEIHQQWLDARVCVMDSEGLFLVVPQFASETAKKLAKKQVFSLALEFRKRNVTGESRLMTVFKDSGEDLGIGLQFLPKDLYHFNEYTALVEELKGEGILSA